jgi:hypothetical protein
VRQRQNWHWHILAPSHTKYSDYENDPGGFDSLAPDGQPAMTSRNGWPRSICCSGNTESDITILRYELVLVCYARTLANPDGTAILINKRRFSSTL